MPSPDPDRKTAAYEGLRGAILTMELPPGSDLDEAELSGRYGLSRTKSNSR